jgi:hypothetical protein
MKRGGRRPGAGRKFGVPNFAGKEGARQALRVYAQLEKQKGLSASDISASLLTCGVPAVMQREHARLQENIYGKPREAVEVSGEVALLDSEIIRRLMAARRRAGELESK